MVKRKTPEDDPDRLADRLRDEAKDQIQDRDSFDLAFNKLIEVPEGQLNADQRRFRNQVFKNYRFKNPEVSKERLFTKAKGRDLRRDRQTTAKNIVTTRDKFIDREASKVDLKGFDTRKQKFTKRISRSRRLTIPSKVKGKVVFSEKTFVTVKGIRKVRFRDAKGRFASKLR